MKFLLKGLAALVLYVTCALILCPLIFVLFFATGKRAFHFLMAGEFQIQSETKSIVISVLAILGSFGLNFLLMFIVMENLNNNLDPGQFITVPLALDYKPVRQMFCLMYITALPVLEELFWRVLVVKSLPPSFIWILISALQYGFLNFAVIYSFLPLLLAILGAIYFGFVQIVFVEIRKHLKTAILISVSVVMRCAIIAGYYAFLS